jgi:beta-glucanase (GH16 family)
MAFEKLVFEEKFEVDGKPNPKHWKFEVGPKWSNNERQAYTNKRENAFVKNGVLTIQALKNSAAPIYTSARLSTDGIHSWKYGHFIVRAKLPRGVGSWPAIWFLPDDIKQGVHWPFCGEIDLMEHVGRDLEMVHFSLHTGTFNHTKNNHRTYFERISGSLDDFHDYEMIWDETGIVFLIDGIKKVEFMKQPLDLQGEWPFDKPYYLIMNIAIGGTWGGPVADDDFPFVMQISSIKIYQ